MKTILAAFTAILMAAIAMGDSTATDKATAMLKGFEGFRPSVYKCAAGKSTIGYGFTAKSLVAKGHITKGDADKELKRICEGIAAKVRAEIGMGHPLTANEEASVVSFVYNVGWANFRKSTMCRKLKEGKRGATVAAEFRRWVYVRKGGKRMVCKGLRLRRDKEAAAFLRG